MRTSRLLVVPLNSTAASRHILLRRSLIACKTLTSYWDIVLTRSLLMMVKADIHINSIVIAFGLLLPSA